MWCKSILSAHCLLKKKALRLCLQQASKKETSHQSRNVLFSGNRCHIQSFAYYSESKSHNSAGSHENEILSNQGSKDVEAVYLYKYQTEGLVSDTVVKGLHGTPLRWLLYGKSSRQAKRRLSGMVVLEGFRLVNDALSAGATPICLCFCHASILQQLENLQCQLSSKVELYQVSARCMQMLSDTVTPSGLLGLFKRPSQGKAVCPPQSTLPITIVLDELRDPGNAGTLIRTAAAIGCQHVVAMEGCVDVWERKVLRSAMGAHFNIALSTKVSWSKLDHTLDPGTTVLLASSDVTTDQALFPTRLEATTDRCSSIKEPEQPAQLLPWCYYSDVQLKQVNPNYHSDADTDKLPPVALVIGNETKGLSLHAQQFAVNRQGLCVTIPMNETVDSLNSAVAGSVIMYELRRKLLDLNT